MKAIRIALSFCIAVMVAGKARPAEAPPAPEPDEVLRAALPENTMPELKQILTKAMADAPRIISAGLDLEIARSNEKIARSPMLPNVGAGINYGYFVRQQQNQYDIQTVNSDGTTTTTAGPTSKSSSIGPIVTYNVGISQPVYQWGALKNNYRASQLQRTISQRNLEESRRTLATEIRRSYFNLIISANSRELEAKTLKKLEDDLEYQKKLQADGFVTSSIVSAADTRVVDEKTQMRRSKDSYDSQWDAFLHTTGADPSLQQSLKIEIPPVPKGVGDILSKLSERSDGYRPANLSNMDDNIKGEELNYDIYKVRLRPKLNVSLSAYQDTESPDKKTSTPAVLVRDYRAMANVNWNLFDGFATQAYKQQSRARIRQYRNSREQAEHDYHETLKTQVENLRINWDNLVRAEDSLTGAHDTLQVAQKDFESGMVPKSAVDDAKTVLDNSFQAALNARADYYMQIANYLSIRGKDPAVTPDSGK